MEIEIPPRGHARRRDRRGRGIRGPLIPPAMPAWRTRSEKFDRLVASCAARLVRRHPSLADVQFGVEEVPPSDPSAWELGSVAVGRYFPKDKGAALPARIVVYRRPLLTRSYGPGDLADLVRAVLAEQAAQALGMNPEDVDPFYLGE